MRGIGIFGNELSLAIGIFSKAGGLIGVATHPDIIEPQVVIAGQTAVTREEVGIFRVGGHPEDIHIGQTIVMASVDDDFAIEFYAVVAGELAVEPQGYARACVKDESAVARIYAGDAAGFGFDLRDPCMRVEGTSEIIAEDEGMAARRPKMHKGDRGQTSVGLPGCGELSFIEAEEIRIRKV